VTDFLASGMVAFARYVATFFYCRSDDADFASLLRWGFDFVTRYKHASPEAALAKLRADGKAELSLAELRRDGYLMSPDQWLMRILFLESIAGVPGFTAAMVRHLHSTFSFSSVDRPFQRLTILQVFDSCVATVDSSTRSCKKPRTSVCT